MRVIATNAIWELQVKDDDAKIVRLAPYSTVNHIDAIILMCEKILADSGIPMLKKLTKIIQTYPEDIPCYLIGIGSNIKNHNFKKYASPQRDIAIRSFLDEIFRRSQIIGVRGELNKKWLVEYFGYSDDRIQVINNENNRYDKSKLRQLLRKNQIQFNVNQGLIMDFQWKKKICFDYLSEEHQRLIYMHRPEILTEKDKTKLNCRVDVDGRSTEIYLEVDNEWKDYLEMDILDPFLFGVLPYAMRTDHDIECEVPLSEEFHHNVTQLLIPNLCAGDDRFHNSKIIAKTVPYKKRGTQVGCGFSGGVDSFYSLQHYEDLPYENYAPTCLYCGNYVYTSSMDMIHGRAEKVAREGNYKIVKTNTNISEVFPSLTHLYVHFYKTMFGVMCLRSLFKAYIYSTAYDVTHFSVVGAGTKDTAYYELLLISTINMQGFKIIDGGADVTREEKTKSLTIYPLSYDNLNVCLKPSLKINCGECGKCLRTLLTLDMLDSLDLYKKSFDVNKYLRKREDHLRYLIKNKDNVFLAPIYTEFMKKEPELMKSLEMH